MGAGLQRRADVFGEGADVGALAATDANFEERARDANQLQLTDRDPARLALDAFAPAGELVERHAAALQRGMHRRHLLDLAEKMAEHVTDVPFLQPDFLALENLPFRVSGGGGLAQFEG